MARRPSKRAEIPEQRARAGTASRSVSGPVVDPGQGLGGDPGAEKHFCGGHSHDSRSDGAHVAAAEHWRAHGSFLDFDRRARRLEVGMAGLPPG